MSISRAAQLHWLIADKEEAITVECMADGLHVYDNPVGVMTNNPPFPTQMFLLNNYMGLSPRQPQNQSRTSCRLIPTAEVWEPWDCPEIFLPHPALPKWHLLRCMPSQENQRMKV